MTQVDRDASIVDAVARALIDRVGAPWPYEQMSHGVRELWKGHARAAVEAALLSIQQPRPEVIAALSGEIDADEFAIMCGWHRAIEALLPAPSESPKP